MCAVGGNVQTLEFTLWQNSDIQHIFSLSVSCMFILYFILLRASISHACQWRRTGLDSCFSPFRSDPFCLSLWNQKSLLCRRANVAASGSWEIQTQTSITGPLGQHVKFFNLSKQKGNLDFLRQVGHSCWLNRLYCVLNLLNVLWIFEAWIGHYTQGICSNNIQGWMGATQGSSTLTPE